MKKTIIDYFSKLGIRYKKFDSVSQDISLDCIAQAVVLSDNQDLVLAVIPADRTLNFNRLQSIQRREFYIAQSDQVQALNERVGLSGLLPFGDLYQIESFVEKRLLRKKRIIFKMSEGEWWELDKASFQLLQADAWQLDMSEPIYDSPTNMFTLPDLPAFQSLNEFYLLSGGKQEGYISDLSEHLSNTSTLPGLSSTAQRLLMLRSRSDGDIEALIDVVHSDPAVTAQVIRYARASFFAYKGEISSLSDAVTRVLGFDATLNIALGIASAELLQMPQQGSLGSKNFWREAIHMASLCQGLVSVMPQSRRPRTGVAYLTGLLHNFGLLLMGHRFTEEFTILNRVATECEILDLEHLERQLFGMTHMEIGLWLMKYWDMPEEVVACFSQVCHPENDTTDSYAQILQLAMSLSGHMSSTVLLTDIEQDALVKRLGIEPSAVEMVLDKVREASYGLEEIATQLAA